MLIIQQNDDTFGLDKKIWPCYVDWWVFSLQPKEMGTISKAAITHSNMLKLGSTKNEVHPNQALQPIIPWDSLPWPPPLEFIIIIIIVTN
jgi:hypothetical protein